ncbi:hypothetical protein DM01DRAFT_1370690 [Hesseltinella vesiculosa]|uniref:Ribonucleotide reductase large subunit C-terminal domain-containing protein n=1 Tax=Hesseltinella vesiculosa TaxID=101127 RepID=A0A1X2GUF9_9FUNG|nr:hypothetical protein DM01DRAFT_1370690 [Hesseltinella vesiculosa]
MATVELVQLYYFSENTVNRKCLDLDKARLQRDPKNLFSKLPNWHLHIPNIPNIPDSLKTIYKTAWEISQRTIIDMAADRGAFIDQSQSLNVFIGVPNFGKLTSMHFYGWKKGLKTGIYYLSTRPAVDAIKFTVDQLSLRDKQQQHEADMVCSLDNKDASISCSG